MVSVHPAGGAGRCRSIHVRPAAADGTTSTGTVRVTIEPEPPGSNPSPIQILPGEQVGVRFVGIPGRTYRIESSAALTEPWTLVGTVIATRTGIIQYVESLPDGNARFYRARE
ncbi:MAG: hypothetical protein QM845_07970 [Verrucomicrobiota bacterium]|nr:hypothetical protein [Verrucomicrobiota bacterium]